MPRYRESYIFRIETDEPGMFWTGHGDLLVPADDVVDAPAIVLGGGSLINLPDIEQLLNGEAQRMEISVSGVNDETLRYAQEEAGQVPGAPVWIGRVEFNDEWQIAGPVEWEWSGKGRSLTVSSGQAEGGRRRTLSLKVGAGDTTRSRAPYAFFTDADQRRDYPDDVFFSHVAGINAGTSRRWGPSE